MAEHEAGVVRVVRGGGDPEVAEHGIGLPAAQEVDVVGVDASTEEGGGAAGAEAARADPVRINARGILEFGCGVSKSIGDVLGGYVSWLADSVADSAHG